MQRYEEKFKNKFFFTYFYEIQQKLYIFALWKTRNPLFNSLSIVVRMA